MAVTISTTSSITQIDIIVHTRKGSASASEVPGGNWMFWTGVLWGSRGANTCGAMALMAGLDPAAAATVTGAAVLATPCKTAPLATPGPRVMVPAGWMIASDLLAETEAGVWFIKRGVVAVVVTLVVMVIPGVATLATVAETVLLLLLPLIVKPVPAVCIDGLTTVTEGPALDAAAGEFP